MKRFAVLLCLLPFTFTVFSQTPTKKTSPDEIVRGFYAWYLHRLAKNDSNPLKNRQVSLHYLTSQFLNRVPRLSRERDADIIICSQDVDETWESNFKVNPGTINGKASTSSVQLEGKKIPEVVKMNVTLKLTNSGWRIDGVDCAQ